MATTETAPRITDARQAVDLTRLALAHSAALEYFRSPRNIGRANAYLWQRGIDARKLPGPYLAGYAPPSWTGLTDHLRGIGFSDHDLQLSGLSRRCSRGSLIDAFRDRLVLPIRDASGQTIAYTGRDLSGNPDTPKYLHSPTTALQTKGDHLYGLWEAAETSPYRGRPVLVEGPLDVLALASLEDETIAPVCAGGTALTDRQAAQIARLADDHSQPVVLAYDGDAAGRSAALHAGQLLHTRHLDVRLTHLPPGVDPAEHVARGGQGNIFEPAAASFLITAVVTAAITAQGDRIQWVEGKIGAAQAIAPHLATYSPERRNELGGSVAAALDIAPTTLARFVSQAIDAKELEHSAPGR